MRRREVTSEAELAAVVVQWLEALGADVYQEVECSGGVADIVARVHAELWIVETKTAWSLALILQAMERRRDAHRVFIAAPYSRTLRDVTVVCSELGIGVLEVRTGDDGYGVPDVRTIVDGPRWNARPVALAKKLQPEHKTHARAGTNGGRWTPFRRTCEQVASLVRRQPGITLKELVDNVEHHYSSDSSARSSIVHWIEKGKIEGVRIVRGAVTTVETTEAR